MPRIPRMGWLGQSRRVKPGELAVRAQRVHPGRAAVGAAAACPRPTPAHGNEPDGLAVVAAAIEIADSLDEERATLYFDLIYGALNEAARRALEVMMPTGQHKYHSDFARKYYDAGREEGVKIGRAHV